MKTFAMLIRREFWEHRVLLFAPLALCAIYLVLCVFAGAKFSFEWFQLDGLNRVPGVMSPAVYLIMNVVFTILLYLLMAIVAFFYLTDCLYSERKDRSILFWKSMPVSDTMTVLSKLLVGLVAVPLVVYVLALVTNLLAFLVFKVTFNFSPPHNPGEHWTLLTWFKINGLLLADVFVLALWFSPLAAYQMLVSVWAPRAAFVWTLLPPAALILGQKIFFNSWSIAELVGQRLGGVMTERGSPFSDSVDAAMYAINAIPLLARLDMWIGVAIAAALIFFTIRIRRHQDDT